MSSLYLVHSTHLVAGRPLQIWLGVDVSPQNRSSYLEHLSARLDKVRTESRGRETSHETQKVINWSCALACCSARCCAGMGWKTPHEAFKRKAKHRFPQLKCFSAIYVLFFFQSENSAQFWFIIENTWGKKGSGTAESTLAAIVYNSSSSTLVKAAPPPASSTGCLSGVVERVRFHSPNSAHSSYVASHFPPIKKPLRFS